MKEKASVAERTGTEVSQRDSEVVVQWEVVVQMVPVFRKEVLSEVGLNLVGVLATVEVETRLTVEDSVVEGEDWTAQGRVGCELGRQTKRGRPRLQLEEESCALEY